ncbi:hypothetical protein BDA99DRAFT_505580 [Phascolomyces articulosus]|uniref:Uncharacterized protein n=1 Tax=Phascolomyces articulosus TaxID=60185 RepID=A0AAD5KJA5_9FUNG|nr:hypothetical protein BDA99DRAFT_505580 [Phascolomyces articulosus]
MRMQKTWAGYAFVDILIEIAWTASKMLYWITEKFVRMYERRCNLYLWVVLFPLINCWISRIKLIMVLGCLRSDSSLWCLWC